MSTDPRQGMDQRERSGEALEVLRVALEGHQATMWTALPARVVRYNPVANTVDVQPMVRERNVSLTGQVTWLDLPIIPDVLIMWQRGGGMAMTFPITADPLGVTGDECLLVFSSRCIDGWFSSGQISNQPDLRMHDLSDGFAFFGPASLPNVLPNVSTTEAQIRNEAGTSYIGMDPLGNTTVQAETATVTAAVSATVTAPLVLVNAAVSASLVSGPSSIVVTPAGVALTGPSITANGTPI